MAFLGLKGECRVKRCAFLKITLVKSRAYYTAFCICLFLLDIMLLHLGKHQQG